MRERERERESCNKNFKWLFNLNFHIFIKKAIYKTQSIKTIEEYDDRKIEIRDRQSIFESRDQKQKYSEK